MAVDYQGNIFVAGKSQSTVEIEPENEARHAGNTSQALGMNSCRYSQRSPIHSFGI